MNFSLWCREEGTAPAKWIQGLPSNRLNAFVMSSTWNVMLNGHGPTSMRRSISPFTSLREPSKARTAVLLGRTRFRSTFICFRVVTGQTLRADPLSIMTRVSTPFWSTGSNGGLPTKARDTIHHRETGGK
ncbi:hypothetical protein CRG98_006453 [Punica granatum]|uniref:Uncharacterized protein n=1 Tax=Punica granatum TaxID=22663 RepID=A0A2I0KZ78_PUNGR|nr:hypothetical protein CRG98_006453 [Punica granatum]